MIKKLQQLMDLHVDAGDECGCQLVIYRNGELICDLVSGHLDGRRDRIIHSISRLVHADHVEILDGLCLIAVVGRGMVKAKGTAARVFNAVSAAGVNIRMIDQGSSELNIILGVDEDAYEIAMSAIFNEFVK